MPISIDFVAGTRDFLKGTGDVEQALDDVASSLDDVARDSRRAGDKLADPITDAGRDIERSNERVERSFREIADTAKRESSTAGDDVARSYKRGADGASEGVQEIGRESASTAKEAAASFDGSAESIADAFQEVAANAFAGFGPAGLVAGVAAAAGIGFVLSKIQEGTENTEQFKARVEELGDGFITTGGIGAVSFEYIVDKLRQMATSTDGSMDSLKDLRALAKEAGSPFDDLAQAVAGDTEALEKLIRKGEEHAQQLRDQADATLVRNNTEGEAVAKLLEQADAQDRINTKLGEAKKAVDIAAQAEADYAASGGPELERKAALISTVDQAYDDAAGAADNYITAETGLFDTAAYITAMQAKEQALKDYQETLESSALSSEARSFLDSQGQEAAATFLAGYKAATPAQQAELNRIWSEGGKVSSGAYTGALRAGIPATIPGPTVKVGVDTSAYEGFIRGVQNKTIDVPLSPRVMERAGSKAN